MSRKQLRTFTVPVTIAEERTITVRAYDAKDARARIADGKYLRLGRPKRRGFLLIGEPEQSEESR